MSKISNQPSNDFLTQLGGELLGDQQLSEAIERVNQRVDKLTVNQRTKRPNWSWLAVAAAFLLLLAVGLNTLLIPRSVSMEELVAEANIQISTAPFSNSMGPTTTDARVEIRQAAIDSYAAGNYSLAIEHFTSLIGAFPESGPYHLFLGQSYLSIGDHQSALHYLTKAVELDSSNGKPDDLNCDRYYLALAYLANGQTEAGKELLTQCVAFGGASGKRAKEMLKKIGR